MESRQMAHDRGYRDGFKGNEPEPVYWLGDKRIQAPTRALAYFTGYGEGMFAKMTGKLPGKEDRT